VTEQRTVIVTGAGTGIGAATAARLQAKGWRVFATMRRPDPAHHGPDALALDVTSDDSVGAAVKCRTAGNLLTQIISSSSEGTLERRSIRMCLLRCMALLLVHNSRPFRSNLQPLSEVLRTLEMSGTRGAELTRA
jgi:NAD(P)-dependent dehydrogenase (short-subunit alcohol dehydrogenase family)